MCPHRVGRVVRLDLLHEAWPRNAVPRRELVTSARTAVAIANSVAISIAGTPSSLSTHTLSTARTSRIEELWPYLGNDADRLLNPRRDWHDRNLESWFRRINNL